MKPNTVVKQYWELVCTMFPWQDNSSIVELIMYFENTSWDYNMRKWIKKFRNNLIYILRSILKWQKIPIFKCEHFCYFLWKLFCHVDMAMFIPYLWQKLVDKHCQKEVKCQKQYHIRFANEYFLPFQVFLFQNLFHPNVHWMVFDPTFCG